MSLRVGLLVNPIAGIGGPGAHKGSDTDWQAALDAGAEPTAPPRAARFLAALDDTRVVTVPGCMGVPRTPTVEVELPSAIGATTPEDTQRAARALRDAGIDLLCFVGGDGTAADVAAALRDGPDLPVLGIPGGVKITSPVFAHDIEEAAWLVRNLEPGFETVARDVTDLDEAAYRAGRIDVRLRGSLQVPLSPAVQGGKVPTTVDTPLEPLVDQVLESWDPDALYLVGAGSVCKVVKDRFDGDGTLLGVDAVLAGRIIATDLDARQSAALLAEHDPHRDVQLVLSIIGGQGVLLGRGTQVLAPDTLRRIGWDRIHVVAPPEKLVGLRGLWVDSGDLELDASAPKYVRVTSGWHETRMLKLLHGAPQP